MPLKLHGDLPASFAKPHEVRPLTDDERRRIFGAPNHAAHTPPPFSLSARVIKIALFTPLALIAGFIPAYLYAIWQEGFEREISRTEFVAVNLLAGWALIGLGAAFGRFVGRLSTRSPRIDPDDPVHIYTFDVSAAAVVPPYEDEGAALLLQIAPGVVLVDQSQDYDDLADDEPADAGDDRADARARASTAGACGDAADAHGPFRSPAQRVRLITSLDRAALVSIEPVGGPLAPLIVETADGAGFLQPGLYAGDVHDRETVAAVLRAARA